MRFTLQFASGIQRALSALALVWVAVALGGCDFWGHKQKYYTYCDNTGCYTCTPDGCTPTGGSGFGDCSSNADCAEGCYCDTSRGTCTEAGFCDRDSDCGLGFVCDVSRHSCEPGSGVGDGGVPGKDGGNVPPPIDGGVKSDGSTVPPPIDAGTSTPCNVDADCPAGQACTAGKCAPSVQCTKDSDCGAGMKCDSRNTCVPGPTGCTGDADCAAGAYCANGTCKTTGTCSTDADCAAVGSGLVCDGTRGTCVPKTTVPPPVCKADCDCPTGYVCANGACVSRPNSSTLGCVFNYECGQGECVNSQCHAKCTTDANCGTGDTCQNGYCFKNPKPVGGCVYNTDCAAARTCVNGACHVQCKADTDCVNPVDFCDRGLCMPDWRKVPQCKINADCPANQECVNAVCRTHCFANADCGACVGQPLCLMGYCSSLTEQNPQCRVQTDCASTMSCVNAACK